MQFHLSDARRLEEKITSQTVDFEDVLRDMADAVALLRKSQNSSVRDLLLDNIDIHELRNRIAQLLVEHQKKEGY